MPIKIFVGNVHSSASKKELEELFSQYGNITECSVLNNFAFVHMANDDDASAAISDLHGSMFAGQPLTVERAKATPNYKSKSNNMSSGPPRRLRGGIPERVGLTKIFVGNVKDGTTNDELRALFETFGPVAEADVCGGYGFVHMPRQIEALKAINELKGFNLNGNNLNIELSTTNTQGRHRAKSQDKPDYDDGYSNDWSNDYGPPMRDRSRYDPYKLPSRKMGGGGYRDEGRMGGPRSRSRIPGPPRDGGGPIRPPRSSPQGSNDSFARELLDLYLSNPDAFDRYARDPTVQRSLNLNHYLMDNDSDELNGSGDPNSFGMPLNNYYANSSLKTPSLDAQPVMYPNLPPPGMANNGLRPSRPPMPRMRYPGPPATDYTSFE